jgi:hypothetical protein
VKFGVGNMYNNKGELFNYFIGGIVVNYREGKVF